MSLLPLVWTGLVGGRFDSSGVPPPLFFFIVEPRSFEVGMLVWLKYQKYPFWPAVVSAPAPAMGTESLLLRPILLLQQIVWCRWEAWMLVTQTWDRALPPSAAGPGHWMRVVWHGILSEIHAQLPQGICEQCAPKLLNEGAKLPPSQSPNFGPVTAVGMVAQAGTLIPAHRRLRRGMRSSWSSAT